MTRHIRPLAAADIVELQEIDTAAHGETWSRRTFQAQLELSDRIHLVAEADRAIVGHAAAWIDGKSCRISNVAVAIGSGGKGHATGLVLAVIARALSYPEVLNMQLEVRPANRRAQRIYSRFGFMPVGIERDFYVRGDAHGSRDAVVMAVTDVCADGWRERLETIARSEQISGAAA